MENQYKAGVVEQRVISKTEQKFCGWPTLLQKQNGELLAACSGNRRAHICPYGRVQILHSLDQGNSWNGLETITRGPLDDRDAGLVELSDGTVLVTWFSSLAFESKIGTEQISQQESTEWGRIRDALSDSKRIEELGCWSIRKGEGEQGWSERSDTKVGNPHGPILLEDGRLLFAGKFHEPGKTGERGSPFIPVIGCAESLDGGQTWHKLAEFNPMPGHTVSNYHELHAVQAADGRIVVQLRNHNELHQFELLQTESLDGGKTWSPLRSIGVWGYPPHLMRLRDGRLMSTFSHRRNPLGNYFIISADHGQNWSEPHLLTSCPEGDFGYPSTVELLNGNLLTLWYQHGALHQARWVLKTVGG